MNALRSAAGEAQNKGQTAAIALFVSDLHLQPSLPATTRAFFSFLHGHAAHARQLYLLGDIFEYWAGDDDLDSPYAQEVTTELRRLNDSGVKIFWIAGNRDFLAGEHFTKQTNHNQQPKPNVIIVAGQRIALT